MDVNFFITLGLEKSFDEDDFLDVYRGRNVQVRTLRFPESLAAGFEASTMGSNFAAPIRLLFQIFIALG
jgi:hypothetical protein